VMGNRLFILLGIPHWRRRVSKVKDARGLCLFLDFYVTVQVEIHT
jgi:hypothetical protein